MAYENRDMKLINEYLPFLKQLNEDDQHRIIETAKSISYHKGSILLSKKEKCNGLVIVRSGQLRAYFESEDGKEITLYRLLPADVCILTASCVLKNITFEVTLEAEKDSDVWIIPACIWAKLIEKYSIIKKYSMELMSERFSEVMWVMEQMVSRNMAQRIVDFLMEQSVLENTNSLSLTHETIAKNLGTAREVVSRMLKYFENDGALHLSRGHITIIDEKKLKSLAY